MRSIFLAPLVVSSVGLLGVLAPRAFAQAFDPGAPPPPATGSASSPLPPLPPPLVAPEPPATPKVLPPIVNNVVVNNPPLAPAEPTTTDHDAVVGHLGLAYFGQFDVPLGFTGARAAGATVPVQMIGIHYWFTRMRLDVAFGMDVQGGTQALTVGNGTSTGSASYDQPTTTGVAFRLGLPIALFSDRHYTLFIGPEFDFGHATERVPGVPVPNTAGPTLAPPDTTHVGNRTAFGGRAGAEIHFGFLGVPRLTLDATLGLLAELTNGNTAGPNPAGSFSGFSQDLTFHHFSVQSTVGHQPWNIFITNVAASYYF